MITFCAIQPSDIEAIFHLIGWLIFILFLLGIFIAIVIALIRWTFHVNEQIELLNQIYDELRKLKLKKYSNKREIEK